MSDYPRIAWQGKVSLQNGEKEYRITLDPKGFYVEVLSKDYMNEPKWDHVCLDDSAASFRHDLMLAVLTT